MPVPWIRKGKWMFIRSQDGALQRKINLTCFFAIWILPEGPEKTLPHILCLCTSGIDVLVLLGGIPT